MKHRISLIALALPAFIFAGCSKHSPDTAASQPESKDFVSITNVMTNNKTGEAIISVEKLPESKDFVALTNTMTAKTGEAVISVEKLDGKFVSYMVVTGSTTDPHQYAATWFRSRWRINRVVK